MDWKNLLKRKKNWLLIFISSLAFFLLNVFLLEKVIFKIKRFQVGNHEQQKNHLTIIQISDLHFKFSFDWKYKRLIKKIKKINPDLLIITGDALDRSGRLAPLRKFLAKLPEQIPKVAVLGNHDYKSDVSNEKLIKTYSEYGVEHLVNQTKVFNFNYAKLAITGLDDFMEGADDFEKAFANIDGIKNHIILAHNPKHIDKLSPFLRRLNHLKKENEKIKPQLFLSGHTHGGQIKLASYTPGLPVNSGNYVEGWYHTGHGDLYINKGIGTSTIPVRLGARSELTIFDYYPVID